MRHVQDLHASADTQYWHVAFESAADQGDLKIVALPIDKLAHLRRAAVQSGIDVAAAGKQQTIDPIQESDRIFRAWSHLQNPRPDER